jgi:MFS family permease
MFLIRQFSGIALYSQALYFLGISGFNLSLSFQLALGGFGAGLLGNVLAWFLMGYIGRRPMLFTGTLINLTILLTVGIAGIFSDRKSAMLYIAIMINFVQLIYASTIGAVSWSISGEISSATLRAKTQSLCTLTNAVSNWLFNFITQYLINNDQANLGGKAAFVWAALSAIAAVWVWLEVPETKDMSFAELDAAFSAGIKTRMFPRAETRRSESD